MKMAVVLSILVLWCAPAFGEQQDEAFDYATYQEMRAQFGTLYKEGNFAEGARLLEWALPEFPDELLANSYNLALTYMKLEQHDKCVEALKYALDRDVWFNKFMFENDAWEPLKELEGFDAVVARNEALRQDAQKTAKPEFEVVLPDAYEKGRKYPLFIALHGGGGNIKAFRKVWKSEKLSREFITLFVQSSRIVAMNGFNWTEDIDISRKEIAEAYHKAAGDYAIDMEEIIIGGFSSGGVASLEVALGNTIPVSGFVVLCPAQSGSFTEQNLVAAKKRGLRGTILTTEMDPRLAVQKEMVEVLKKTGFEHRFVITPDIGHWIPEDLNVQIDDSIDHIRDGR